MATPGKRNQQDDDYANIEFYCMYSWTLDEYLAATADPVFFDKIVLKLDATSATEVNEDSDDEDESSEEEKRKRALDLKFYYAGGSCRFLFEYPTTKVKNLLETAVKCARNTLELVTYLC